MDDPTVIGGTICFGCGHHVMDHGADGCLFRHLTALDGVTVRCGCWDTHAAARARWMREDVPT